MEGKQYIICGTDAHHLQPEDGSELLHLHLYGPDDDHKITLEIEDIRRRMFKEVPERLRDLLDIATYVYAADQAIKRGVNDVETFGTSWRRRFHFVLPVADLDFWQTDSVNKILKDTLGFLSDDHYEFEFTSITQRPSLQGFLTNLNNDGAMLGFPEQVVMFSGGLDSLGGAVEEIVNQKRRLILVNHRATQKLDKRYSSIKDLLDSKAEVNKPTHIRVTVNKKKWMNKEHTQRSRSFLYVTLGAVIAHMLGQTNVRFYENGVISMNLPICAQVVGGKATRTTHPRVFDGFQKLLSVVMDNGFSVENPFIWKTKAEVVDLIVKSGCEGLVGPSISCTHTWEMTTQHSHCGTCSQCLDRRFAVIAANAEKYDPIGQYSVDVFTQSRDRTDKVHEDKTMFANYLERANQVERVPTATQFLAKYPEVARALQYMGGEPGSTSQRCFDLYRRHAREVNSVVDKMFAVHSSGIRQRLFPPDALMRIVCESYLPISTPAIPPQEEPLPDNIFRRSGGAWQVRFRGQKPFTLLPWLGASYIHYLLCSPNESQQAVELVCKAAIDFCDVAISNQEAIEQGLQSASNPMLASLGDISDWAAVEAYRKEAQELLAEIQNARNENNNVLEKQYQNDLAMIVRKINEAVGIGGRLKQDQDKRKNVRDSFRNNVKRVIDQQIRETDPALAEHLDQALSFGNSPKYTQIEPFSWETEPVRNS